MMCNNKCDVFVWYREETAEQGGFEGDGRYTVRVSCLVETAVFRSTCASLVLSNGCFWWVTLVLEKCMS
jgi:hypothetical protein